MRPTCVVPIPRRNRTHSLAPCGLRVVASLLHRYSAIARHFLSRVGQDGVKGVSRYGTTPSGR